MTSRAALRIVERPTHYVEEGAYWSADARQAHSLHYTISYPESFSPEFAAFAVGKYSKRGEVVLDPFCGSGTAVLESALQGRIALGSDVNPLAVRVAGAKLNPADITEVTLWLQGINLSRPVALEHFRQVFAPFYEVDTFRELVNLRAAIGPHPDHCARFIQLVALSLLHGHSAGFFSVYTFPQISLLPEDQEKLNVRRRQNPDYRAVAPRLLRKAAMAMRDGRPSVLTNLADKNRVELSDARNLSFVPAASVDLLVTAPPHPQKTDWLSDFWLKFWFAGISSESVKHALYRGESIREWRDFMNEVLLELARVVKPGGRGVFYLPEVMAGSEPVCLDMELSLLARQHLSRYWDPECTLVNHARALRIGNTVRHRGQGNSETSERVLILRRR